MQVRVDGDQGADARLSQSPSGELVLTLRTELISLRAFAAISLALESVEERAKESVRLRKLAAGE